jgi:putative protein kinase ArgK-like GTPase of G3E family
VNIIIRSLVQLLMQVSQIYDSARISRLVLLAATSKMTGLRPLITICGTTGVGKSKLAIELALKLAQGTHSRGWKGARIINADSMQVYTGIDVITIKSQSPKGWESSTF